MANLRPIDSRRLPEESVVMLPYVLNHLLDNGHLPPHFAKEMANWIVGATERGCRIVVTDVNPARLSLWEPVLRECGKSVMPTSTSFATDMAPLSCLYPSHDVGRHRSGQRHEKMTNACVLAIDERRGWRFLGSRGNLHFV
jgi:hypothetical protein